MIRGGEYNQVHDALSAVIAIISNVTNWYSTSTG